MEIGKSYLLSIEGIPLITSVWQDNFILLDETFNGTLVLYNIRLKKEFYINQALVEVIHENN